MGALRCHGEVPPELVESAAAVIGTQTTLEHVVRWGLTDSPPRLVAEVVKQDEFTLDVVLPWRGVYLVYDTT
jgi:hypothetical protein